MTRDVSDVTHRKRGLRFEKSQLVEIETWERPDEFVRYGRRTWWGANGKVSIERLYLSPYVEKAFNSKVPELSSRCVSGFLCYLWTFYEHYMYVSHIHVWVCYNSTDVKIITFKMSLKLHSRSEPCLFYYLSETVRERLSQEH